MLAMVGCCEFYEIPQQTPYTPLSQAAALPDAMVRLYGEPIVGLGPFAIHTWILTKRAGSPVSHRWEIWLCPEGDNGYVCRNVRPLEDAGR